MTTVDKPPTKVAGEPFTQTGDPEVEILFAEARSRARRRRIRNIVAVVILLAVVVAAGFTARALLPVRHRVSAPLPRPAAASTVFPSTFVAYDVDYHTNVGGIRLFATATGKVVRTIVPISFRSPGIDQFANLGQGFQLSNDGKTVFYAKTLADQITTQIVSVPVTGGRSKVLATGSNPAVSANGRLLAYQPNHEGSETSSLPANQIGLLDLQSGSRHVIAVPHLPGNQPLAYAWLPGSTELFISSTDVEGPPAMIPAGGAPIVKDPTLVASSWLYSTVTGHFTRLSAATTTALQQTATSDVTLLGPAEQPDVVRVSGSLKSAGSSVPHEAIGTLDVKTGRLVWQHMLPTGDYLAWPAALAGQTSGQHFLLQGPTGLLSSWTPASGKAPAPIAATLDTTGIEPRS